MLNKLHYPAARFHNKKNNFIWQPPFELQLQRYYIDKEAQALNIVNFVLRNMKVLPKLIRVLELFSNGDTLSFAQIVEKTALPRSNAAHIVKALCSNDLLSKTKFGHYCMGPKIFQLTGGDFRQNLLYMLSQRAADRIAGELGELGVAVACWHKQRITLAKVQPEGMVQLNISDRWFENSGWYRLSSGRLLLALQSDETLKEIVGEIGMPTAAQWPEAITWEKLQQEISLIRQNRCAVVMRENRRLTSVAVPIQDASGKDALCVSTVYITGRHQLPDAEILDQLRKIADELHSQICFHHISIEDINQIL